MKGMSYKFLFIVGAFFCVASISSDAQAQSSSQLVVLIPGAGSSGDEISIPDPVPFSGFFNGKKYFDAYVPIVQAAGADVLVCPSQHHGDHASLDQRTQWCQDYLIQNQVCTHYSNVRFIGHSMGGIVAERIYESFSKSSQFSCVTDVLAVSTPFFGSDLADVVVAEESKSSVIGKLLRLFDYTSRNHAYIADVTRAKMRFNVYASDDGHLSSITNFESKKRVTLLSAPRKILSTKIIEEDSSRSPKNDGVVPTDSMRLGTVIAEVEANHFETGCFSIFKHTRACNRTLKSIEKWLKLSQK